MSFSIKLDTNDKNETFFNIFKNIKPFTQNININIQKTHFYIQFLDINHICLGELFLDASWFSEYNCIEDITIGINSDVFTKILKCRRKNDIMEIIYNTQTNADVIGLHFYSNVDNTIHKNYEMPLLDLDNELLDIPKASQGQADIKMDSTMLSTIITELYSFGQDVTIKINEESIVMETQEDGEKCDIHIDIEKIDMFSIDEDTELSLSYSLKYIHMIMAFSKVSNKIYFTLGEHNPIMFQYTFDKENEKNEKSETDDSDNEIEIEDKNYMRLFLAPKCSD
jgi:proliferating cell nuclear antigen PCNA